MNTENHFYDDPKFTAYALGELSHSEEESYLAELLASGIDEKEIRNQATHLMLMSEALKGEFAKDETLRASIKTREKIMNQGSAHRTRPWFRFASAFSVAALVGLTSLYVMREQSGEEFEKAHMAPQMEVARIEADAEAPATTKPRAFMARQNKKMKMKRESFAGGAKGLSLSDNMMVTSQIALPSKPISIGEREEYNREAYEKIDANSYLRVADQPLSTFSVDVDTASYANMRRFLLRGQLPLKDSLRVEELINYFHYDYSGDFKEHPVAITADTAQSIWHKERKIVRVGLLADSPSNLTNAPKNLVFLMDVSGSMSDPKKLPLLKESMKLLLRKLKKTDTISLVVYAGAAGVVLEPTQVSEKVKILQALDRLNAGGSTNGGAGIEAAYKMAKQGFVKNGVNRVILATDGDFNVGTSSQSELISMVEEKAKNDIFLTVVGLGMGNYQDALLEKISNRGNGNYAYIDSLSEANKLFNIDLEKNMTTVAKDVKVQIEFNPKLVQAYRLIGYENRVMAAQDFNNDKKDAGEMGAGHTVTALYEIVPTGVEFKTEGSIDKLKYAKEAMPIEDSKLSDELLTVKVRYKQPTGDKSVKFEVPLKDNGKSLADMDQDFRFATAVASFGMKLRGDDMVQDLTYRDIESLAKKAQGKDEYDFREEFLEMIDLAKQIDK